MGPILEVKNLETRFLTEQGSLRAVNQVSFSILRGQTMGLVGESGCGKSVTALSILRLVYFPGEVCGGEVWYARLPVNTARGGEGETGTSAEVSEFINLLTLPESRLREIRGAEIAMIFQEPLTALNPVFTIGDQITETILAHDRVSRREAKARAVESLHAVAVPVPERRMREYPHQLSGGLRQRAMIAMALAARPRLLIADEPTTALDVTVQAQILDLLARLKEDFQLSLLIISHDLGVIARISDRVAVMYAGRIVEEGTREQIFARPLHPYTEALLKVAPRLERSASQQRLEAIPGGVPDLRLLPPGCAFQPRCRYEMGLRCSSASIDMIEPMKGQRVRCIKYA
jgi:peptide/nickel transport system ATP-binding protein